MDAKMNGLAQQRNHEAYEMLYERLTGTRVVTQTPGLVGVGTVRNGVVVSMHACFSLNRIHFIIFE